LALSYLEFEESYERLKRVSYKVLSKEEFSKAFSKDDNFKTKEVFPNVQFNNTRNLIEKKIRQIVAEHSHHFDKNISNFNPIILNKTKKSKEGFKPVNSKYEDEDTLKTISSNSNKFDVTSFEKFLNRDYKKPVFCLTGNVKKDNPLFDQDSTKNNLYDETNCVNLDNSSYSIDLSCKKYIQDSPKMSIEYTDL